MITSRKRPTSPGDGLSQLGHRGYRIDLEPIPQPDPEGHEGWKPRAVVWVVFGGARMAHPVVHDTVATSRDEANAMALQRAKSWIDAMGNPKAALEDAVFQKLCREPGGFLDFVIAEYFDPHHTIAAARVLSRPEQRILNEALRTNWKRTLHTISLTRPSKDEWILDAGCAVGGTAFRLSKSGANVVAFDINPGRLSTGRQILRRLRAQGFSVKTVYSLPSLPLAGAVFARFFCAVGTKGGS